MPLLPSVLANHHKSRLLYAPPAAPEEDTDNANAAMRAEVASGVAMRARPGRNQKKKNKKNKRPAQSMGKRKKGSVRIERMESSSSRAYALCVRTNIYDALLARFCQSSSTVNCWSYGFCSTDEDEVWKREDAVIHSIHKNSLPSLE